MSRIPIATIVGLVGFTAYVVAAVTLADALPANWIVQGVYYAVAGLLWTIPIRSLMLWAARK